MRRLVVSALLAAGLLVPGRAAIGDALPVCDGAWHVEPGPRDGQVLQAVSSRWIQGAWAVGWVYDATIGARRTYIEHWNGTMWKRSASPNVDPSSTPGDNQLFGVVGIGADIWAVGGYAQPGDHTHSSGHFPLVMHDDGGGWVVVPADPATGQATLYDVWQVSPNDVWAVGSSWTGDRPVAEHWDGSAWHDVPVPDPTPYDDRLSAISGSAADDLWAVGSAGGGFQTLAEHWDGSAWTRVPTPNQGAFHQALADVSVRRDGRAFAVGSFDEDDTATDRTLVERLTDAWTIQPSPNPATARDVLLGVDRGPHNLQRFWAVGWRQESITGPERPLILHLGGGRWRVQRAPNPFPGGSTELVDVAVFGRATFDAVGALAVGNGFDEATGEGGAVILRRCEPPPP